MCTDKDEDNRENTGEQPSVSGELSSCAFCPSERYGIWQVQFCLSNENLDYRLLRGLKDDEGH